MINHFPKTAAYTEPRQQQKLAIDFVERSIKAGYRYVVLESPVGSGKSGVAATIANWSKDAFILTPGVALQKQYQDDFNELRLAKGRGHYPCTMGDQAANTRVIHRIKSGEHVNKPDIYHSCAKGPCIGTTNGTRTKILAECAESGPCPYDVMLDEALKSDAVVFNYHAFFFQCYLAGKFQKRKLMIIDEAHGLENFLRGVLSLKFSIPRNVIKTDVAHYKTVQQWANWLKFAENVNLFADKEKREAYLGKIEKLEAAGEKTFGKEVIVNVQHIDGKFQIEFLPDFIGNSAHEFLFNFAETIVFMSGTIYNKQMFGNPLGISSDDIAFTRIESDFPKDNRPVVMPRTTLDLSHKNWDTNFHKAMLEVKHILAHHRTEKGIIHTSSYRMSAEIYEALKPTGRVVTHTNENLAAVLNEFYASDKPEVMISCSVNEGVDFKDDRARFSVIVRPAHLSADDKFVQHQLKFNRWDWYFYKSLVVLGQQSGRIVRSNKDYGVVYLLDYRFVKFMQKVDKWLPKWFKQGLVK